jgi:hypothetical protein
VSASRSARPLLFGSVFTLRRAACSSRQDAEDATSAHAAAPQKLVQRAAITPIASEYPDAASLDVRL